MSPLLLAGLVLTAFTLAETVVEKLGMTQQNTQRLILNNLVGRQHHDEVNVASVEDGASSAVGNQLKAFTLPRVRGAVSLAVGDRAAAARELCLYVKDYVSGEGFKAAYRAAREQSKPGSEPYVMDAAMIAEMKKGLKEQEVALSNLKANKQVPAAMLKQMEQGIAEQKKMIAASGDPTPNKTQWERSYPENPDMLLKSRLEEYLKLVATVDFSAKLVDDRGKKKFANPAYEGQSLKWKAIYRAGKEVNDEVTRFAKSWLKELPTSSSVRK